MTTANLYPELKVEVKSATARGVEITVLAEDAADRPGFTGNPYYPRHSWAIGDKIGRSLQREALGRRIHELRDARAMPQETPAEAAGLHRAAVGLLERAERDFGVSYLSDLAQGQGVPVAELFLDE